MTHDELQHDLAECRRACGEIVGEKIGLGSWGGCGECDVVAVRPSWSKPRPTVYEVKISRADFLADVRAEKWRKYLPYCSRLSFAAPAGMVDKREVPKEAGLIVRGPNGWRAVRAAPLHPKQSDRYHDLLFALLLKDHPAPWRRPPRIDPLLATEHALSMRHLELGRVFGARVRDLVHDRDELRHLRQRMDRVNELLRPLVPDRMRAWGDVEQWAEYCAENLPPHDTARTA